METVPFQKENVLNICFFNITCFENKCCEGFYFENGVGEKKENL
jgi:hypothetical protein